MLFSSITFLYIFLPLSIFLSLISGKRLRNFTLLILSLGFCAWGGANYTLLLLGSIVTNYLVGRFIGNSLGTGSSRLWLSIGIFINIGLLIIFKYLGFFNDSINSLFHLPNQFAIHLKKFAFPIAISYYTFHNISYLIDIYWERAKVQKNFLNFSLYITFFPKFIAGPIVRYSQIADQLTNHRIDFAKFANGAERFIIGLGKKILLANTFAVVADKMFALPIAEHSIYSSWVGIISYTLQIYYDFSGYSDMAIGLASIFGFEFPENFNFPYISRSIQEFWQRWHISLSNWLREYLFTPLSLKFRASGKFGIIISLIITFGLCGLWHGPSWTYVLWGLLHGIFLALESIGLSKILKKIWPPLRHLYVLIIIILGWVLFRSETFEYAKGFLSSMIGYGSGINKYAVVSIYLTNEFYLCFIIALLGSARIFSLIQESYIKLSYKFPSSLHKVCANILFVGETAGLIIIMYSSTMYMVTTTYNPFIYFRF